MRYLLLAAALGFAATTSAQEGKPPITAEQALKKVDENIVVEMLVKSTGGNTARYLNSESDFRSNKNFAVYIPRTAMAKFKEANIAEPADYYKNKTIRATGTVFLNEGRPQLKADSPEQIQVVGGNKELERTNPDDAKGQ
jgi:hypothetical protein